jgi:murein L,D-transpeptidase YcbB/YkuD
VALNRRIKFSRGASIMIALALLLGTSGAVIRRNATRAAEIGQEPAVAGQKLSPEGLETLHKIIESANDPDLRWPDFAPYRDAVTKFYEAGGYALAWIQGGKPTAQAIALATLLRDADQKGLNADDYGGTRWAERLASLATSALDTDRARCDVALTVSVMRYARAVHTGRVNPKEFKFELDVENRRLPLAEFVRTKLMTADDPAAVLQSVEPTFPGYRRLLAALPAYTEMATKDDSEKLQVPAKTVAPGQSYASTARLAKLLKLTRDLPADADVSGNSGVYEGALVDGVKHYQSRHGEQADGRLDAKTVNELNTPLSFRVRQIQLTLERWRWLSHSFTSPPIVVNLPEFRARAMDHSGEAALVKNVIVGKAYEHKSPVFEKEMRYVVFRPYWEVAPSIERNEMIPHIAKDRDYVGKERMEVVTSDNTVVTAGHVSDEVLAGLKSGKYRLRQKPGPKNSLGLVKMIFPNDDSVYLHGTDEPGLFSNTVRDFSHGCIRVQNPADLAAWTLRNNPGWDLERVKATMNGTEENVQVNLVTTIPVFIVYGTAAVNEADEVFFFDDIYGYDADLEKALAHGYPYPW